MKFKYILLFAVVMILLFSIGSAVASDNAPDYDNYPESVDLSVSVDNGKYHTSKDDEIIWTVVTTSEGGTSKNTQVLTQMSNLEYISHMTETGNYNHKKGVWNIGDLDDSASLKIITKPKINQGRVILAVEATTDSNDINLENNRDYQSVYITNDYTTQNHHPAATSSASSTMDNSYSNSDGSNYRSTHYNPNEYSGYRTVTKSSDEQSFYAKTNKTIDNKTIDNKTDNKSAIHQTNQINKPSFDFTPIIILAILFAIALFAIYRRYDS